MDDNSCVLKYIEIVPLDNSAQQFEDIKPFEVKVCIATKLNKVELLLCLLKTHVNPDIISVIKCGKLQQLTWFIVAPEMFAFVICGLKKW